MTDEAMPEDATREETAPSDEAAASNETVRKPVDDVEYLLQQAEEALGSVSAAAGPSITQFELPELGAAPPSTERVSLELVRDVELGLRIELGRTRMNLEDVLKLQKGSVVTLDKLAGDPVDVFVNGRLVARGEVLVLNDNFCVRVTELVSGHDFQSRSA